MYFALFKCVLNISQNPHCHCYAIKSFYYFCIFTTPQKYCLKSNNQLKFEQIFSHLHTFFYYLPDTKKCDLGRQASQYQLTVVTISLSNLQIYIYICIYLYVYIFLSSQLLRHNGSSAVRCTCIDFLQLKRKKNLTLMHIHTNTYVQI